ncbi:hypothetical protein DL93DRAFT_2167819 [Clavulina sp. PMI_390]|nr:hypothetical protein DL93DRAFT_2167819 [Clavulina sp. PMI_390]
MDVAVDGDEGPRPPPKARKSHSKHHRHVSNPSASSLPTYRSRHAPSGSMASSALWDVAEDSPPDYSLNAGLNDPFTLPPSDPTSADEADAEYDDGPGHPAPSSLYPRLSLPPSTRDRNRPAIRHRRSRSERPFVTPSRLNPRSQPWEDQTDAILQRSVQALEMSNALLQSSINTRTSLAHIAADDDDLYDSPSHPSTFRIDSLSRRFAAGDIVDAQMDELLASAHDITGGLSQSAPTTSFMPTLLPSSATHTPSQSSRLTSHSSRQQKRRSRRSPSPSRFHTSHPSVSTISIDDLPHNHATPAYSLLSSFDVRNAPSSRRRSSVMRPVTPSLPDLRVPHSPAQRSQIPANSQDARTPSSSRLLQTRSFESLRSIRRTRRSSPRARFPKSALVGVISPRFFESRVKHQPSPPPSAMGEIANQSGSPTIARLRNILSQHAGSSSAINSVLPTIVSGNRDELASLANSSTPSSRHESPQRSPMPPPLPSPLSPSSPVAASKAISKMARRKPSQLDLRYTSASHGVTPMPSSARFSRFAREDF